MPVWDVTVQVDVELTLRVGADTADQAEDAAEAEVSRQLRIGKVPLSGLKVQRVRATDTEEWT